MKNDPTSSIAHAAAAPARQRKSEAQCRVELAIGRALQMNSAVLRHSTASEEVADLRDTIRDCLMAPEARLAVQGYAAELDAEARGRSYVILEDPAAMGGHAILCLRCRLTSHNRNDVEHLYCAHCNQEHER